MSHVHVFSIHMYFFSHIFTIVNCFGTFLIVSFSLPLFMFTLVVSMVWYLRVNLLRLETLFIPKLLHLLILLLSLCFHDDNAHKAFLKNFSRRGVHLERQVILADFVDIDLPIVIHSQECESLCDFLVTCPLILI